MMKLTLPRLVTLCFLLSIFFPSHQVSRASQSLNEIELITPEEALYPSAPSEQRGPVPGPTIQIVSPPSDVAQISPIRLILRFKAYGGTVVDKDSARLIYEKDPLVELTPRVAPYVTSTGLMLQKAKVPPGTHIIRIQLKDSAGRIGATNFSFTVRR
jgi:hypothetical protein